MTKEEAKQKIAELLVKYESLSLSAVKAFNEANTKQGFIEPLFKALGWNVDDTNEVTLEEKASNGRVDYAFKLHGVSQFYLEAKPLKADLTNESYIKQAVTYAYNKGVTWVVLTDFEELRLFNAQQNKPFITLNCRDYAATFDKLWLLSRESLAEGLLNKEAAQYGALPPALPVEKRLFTKLRQWREDLFNQLDARLDAHNEKLSYSQIDEVIQRLFNRLIFIRTCEDRNIEDKRLLAAANQWKSSGYKGELFDELKSVFNEYNDIYDSELFDKHSTDQVYVLATTIEEILTGLYEIPGSLASYNFNDIDADVLGAVYEQYLGYVATKVKEKVEAQLRLGITDEETYKLISKKQHRKEQGIYYTPEFITDYIVKETVGRFISEHSYNEIRTMKILDPACGSGSFLIRAYDELLNYHAKQRNRSLNELDQKDRLPVLLTNIYGVDLDMQAVEITRLNLLLRTLTEKGKLPYLSNNIRQGNSLISGTEEELKKYFGDDWEEKKPLNWEQEFEDIMVQGGFDVVIGNPPWVSLKGKFGVNGFAENEISYLTEKYRGNTYRPNIVEYFIKHSLTLLKDGGFHSFVIPDRVFANLQFEDLRTEILQNCKIHSLVYRVPFPGTIADAAIYVVQKIKPPKHWKVDACEWGKPTMVIPQAFYLKSPDHSFVFLGDQKVATIMEKLEKIHSLPLEQILNSNVGFIAGRGKVTSKPTSQDDMAVYKGENILRYAIRGQSYFIFTKTNLVGGTQDKDKLGIEEKILLRKTGDRISATLDKSGNFPEQSLYFLYTSEYKQYDIRYVLALLNSCLLNFYYINRLVTNRDTMPQLKKAHLDRFPIRRIDFANPKDKKMHDDLVALVERMLELNKKLAPIRNTPFSERDTLLKEIERTDRGIDNLVYELYGLTEEERKIVEGEVTKL